MLVPKFKLLMNITVKPRSIVCADCGSVPYTEEKDKKEYVQTYFLCLTCSIGACNQKILQRGHLKMTDA